MENEKPKKRGYTTIKQVEAMKRLHAEGKNNREIAKVLGLSGEIVGYWLRKSGLKSTWIHAQHETYAVYKRDELVAVGTADECAAMMGIKTASFWSNMSRSKRKGESKRQRYQYITLEREDNEREEGVGSEA